jgi:ankyrin repeat protein
MQKEEECKRFLKEYSPKVSDEFRTACNRSIERLSQYMNELQSLKATTEEENIFYAIRMNNMNDFLSCFSRKKGVDLTQCNEDGFSPLTWTVKTGNTEMIKFFIDHKEEIDLSQKDRLGYNAFETAVICHNQNICELLLSADQSLARGCSRSLRDLAKENNFENWIAQLN